MLKKKIYLYLRILADVLLSRMKYCRWNGLLWAVGNVFLLSIIECYYFVVKIFSSIDLNSHTDQKRHFLNVKTAVYDVFGVNFCLERCIKTLHQKNKVTKFNKGIQMPKHAILHTILCNSPHCQAKIRHFPNSFRMIIN